MRKNAKRAMPESSAENELHENHRRKPNAQRPKLRAARVVKLRKIALPPVAGQHREADERDEKYLRDCGVNRSDKSRMTQQHASGAQKRLRNNEREGNPGPAVALSRAAC